MVAGLAEDALVEGVAVVAVAAAAVGSNAVAVAVAASVGAGVGNGHPEGIGHQGGTGPRRLMKSSWIESDCRRWPGPWPCLALGGSVRLAGWQLGQV